MSKTAALLNKIQLLLRFSSQAPATHETFYAAATSIISIRTANIFKRLLHNKLAKPKASRNFLYPIYPFLIFHIIMEAGDYNLMPFLITFS